MRLALCVYQASVSIMDQAQLHVEIHAVVLRLLCDMFQCTLYCLGAYASEF